jgi:starch phosphorylase
MASSKKQAIKFRTPVQENPLANEIVQALRYRFGKDPSVAMAHDWLNATIRVVRDRIIDQWIANRPSEAYERSAKRVYYLSLEFLIGRLTRDAFSNIGMLEDMREAHWRRSVLISI